MSPTIYDNRVKILDGGYIEKDGYCFVNIRFQAAKSLAGNSTWTIFSGLPTPEKIYPFLITPYGIDNEDLWLPVSCAITSIGNIKFKSTESFSTGCFSVIGIYKIA